MKHIKLFEELNNNYNEYIVYHSSDSIIDEFDFDKVEIKPQSSTRIDGIFFSDKPQRSWGENVYKVKILSNNPAIYDLSSSRFDSLGIQEAFDALLRGETSYIIEDLVDYGGMEEDDASELVEGWEDLDLIILKNSVYATHSTEYIVPESYYNGNTSKIINLGKFIDIIR